MASSSKDTPQYESKPRAAKDKKKTDMEQTTAATAQAVEKEKEAIRLKSELAKLARTEAELEQTQSELDKTRQELNQTSDDLSHAMRDNDDLQEEVARLRESLKDCRDQVKRLEGELTARQPTAPTTRPSVDSQILQEMTDQLQERDDRIANQNDIILQLNQEVFRLRRKARASVAPSTAPRDNTPQSTATNQTHSSQGAFRNKFVRLPGEYNKAKSEWKAEFRRKLTPTLQNSLAKEYRDPTVTFKEYARLEADIAMTMKQTYRKKEKERKANATTGGRSGGSHTTRTQKSGYIGSNAGSRVANTQSFSKGKLPPRSTVEEARKLA
ncbi:hypothetical protein QBC46DRAFT_347493 [Diplogelasinospora grovesii]|uniref:Uncharacterized protein n=1 Tax=Diplogelasinospora grovesii TaxID=303347 RepID=A0AAN6MX41_9PEZI|nr:hypothetical protein QBC46DRAFT_347493 [Diplogelasinospora grovesii]